MRHRESRRPTLAVIGLLAGAGVLGGGVALAQKPPGVQQPAPVPPQRLPTTKPPALGAPQQPQPPRMVTPTPPPPAPTPAPGGKPGAQPPAPPSVVTPPGIPPRPPVATPTPTPTPPQPPVATPAQPVPANEPAAITAMRRLMRNSQLTYAAAETLDPATGRARMTGVVVMEADGSRITADEVVVEEPSETGARLLTVRNMLAERSGERFVFGEIEIRNLVLRAMLAGTGPSPEMVEFERIAVRDARMAGRDTNLTVRSAEMEGWGQGRITRMELNGFDMTFPAGSRSPFDRLSIGRLASSGMDLSGAIAAALAGRPATYQAGEPFFELETVAAGMHGQVLGTIASLSARSRVDATGSGTGTIAIRGVRVLPMPGLSDWLTRYGYNEINAELTAESAYDARTGRLDLSAFRIAGQDVGALSISVLVDGLTQQAMLVQDFSAVRLFGASIGWIDQSILQRAIRDMARTMGSTEQALREQWAGMAGAALSQRGSQGMDGVRDAILRYIRGQASQIEIRAQPAQPVPVMQLGTMGSPAQVQQALGITATAR